MSCRALLLAGEQDNAISTGNTAEETAECNQLQSWVRLRINTCPSNRHLACMLENTPETEVDIRSSVFV